MVDKTSVALLLCFGFALDVLVSGSEAPEEQSLASSFSLASLVFSVGDVLQTKFKKFQGFGRL